MTRDYQLSSIVELSMDAAKHNGETALHILYERCIGIGRFKYSRTAAQVAGRIVIS